ncbi:RtcB family protein [Streptomyces sp. 2MCAF27]
MCRCRWAVRPSSSRGPAEETPAAYKDVDAMATATEGAGLVRIVARLIPSVSSKDEKAPRARRRRARKAYGAEGCPLLVGPDCTVRDFTPLLRVCFSPSVPLPSHHHTARKARAGRHAGAGVSWTVQSGATGTLRLRTLGSRSHKP